MQTYCILKINIWFEATRVREAVLQRGFCLYFLRYGMIYVE